MAKEIERKFLLLDDSWRKSVIKKVLLSQGYMSRSENCTVRIRMSPEQAWLTLKGPRQNISRSEFEYTIPLDDAKNMLQEFSHGRIVEKYRHFLEFAGHEWVVDDFLGKNSGLVMAEIELPDEDTSFALPPWAGPEVSDNRRYTNAYLAEHPYSEWPDA